MEEEIEQNKQKIEAARKTGQRNSKDIEAIKKQLESGDFKMPEKDEAEEDEEEDDELGGDSVAKLQALIMRTEKQLIQRISKCEDYGLRLNKHDDQISQVQNDIDLLRRSGGSGGGGGIGAAQEDIDRWNDAANKMAELDPDLQ